MSLALIRQIHAQISAAAAAPLIALAQDARAQVRAIAPAIANIERARTAPVWSGSAARVLYDITAWTARTSAEGGQLRLNRLAMAAEYLAPIITQVKDNADSLLQFGETNQHDVIAVAMCTIQMTMQRVALQLGIASAEEYLTAEEFNEEQLQWLSSGSAKTLAHDLYSGNDIGPRIPDTLANLFGGDDWIPQGLTYDEDSGHLYQTSYTKDGQATLTILDPETGEIIKTVRLDGWDGGSAPDHAGGVSVDGDNIWVSSSDDPPRVFRYSLSDVTSGQSLGSVGAVDPPQEVAGGAYQTIHGGRLYAGTFNEDADGQGVVSVYDWNAREGRWNAEPSSEFNVPGQVQGMVIRGDDVVFSTSWGRDNPGHLSTYSLSDLESGNLGEPSSVVELPNMAEGIALGPDGVYTTYESGTTFYDPYADPDYSKDKGGDVDDLWAGTHMTVTPYSELGLGGTLDVEPATVREGAMKMYAAEEMLRTSKSALAALALPGGCLGQVPGADAGVAAFNKHAQGSADWLRVAATVSAKCGDSAKASADDFESTDGSVATAFQRGTGLIP